MDYSRISVYFSEYPLVGILFFGLIGSFLFSAWKRGYGIKNRGFLRSSESWSVPGTATRDQRTILWFFAIMCSIMVCLYLITPYFPNGSTVLDYFK